MHVCVNKLNNSNNKNLIKKISRSKDFIKSDYGSKLKEVCSIFKMRCDAPTAPNRGKMQLQRLNVNGHVKNIYMVQTFCNTKAVYASLIMLRIMKHSSSCHH